VRPLLFKCLSAFGPDFFPHELLTEWENEFRNNAARNLQLTAELITICNRFAAAGIPVIPHKGPLLAQVAYGDLALREYTDLDLLVHSSDLPEAVQLLADFGYLPPPGTAWLPARTIMRWTGEMTYSSARETAVDLHWELTPDHYPLRINPEILWNALTSITIGGAVLPSLSPEAYLLLLSVHGAKHCWESIGWLADIAWLIHANPKLDWHALMEMAAESGCERAVLLAASLVRDLYQSPLPDWVSTQIEKDGSIATLKQRVTTRWSRHSLQSPQSPELLAFASALARRKRDALRHLLGVAFYPTEADWSVLRLPEAAFPLYFAVHAGRLAAKYVLRWDNRKEVK
jgi:hypothetical protein